MRTLATEKDREVDRRARREAFIRDLYGVMEQKGVTQRELRDELGWGSHTTMNRWRHLIAEPLPDEVFELERILGVAPGTLSAHLGYMPLKAERLAGVEAAVEADQIIPPWGKEILLTAYREIMRSLGPRKR